MKRNNRRRQKQERREQDVRQEKAIRGRHRSRGVRRHRTAPGMRQPGRTRWRRLHGGATSALRGFRQSTILAVALVTMLLFLLGKTSVDAQQPEPADGDAQIEAAQIDAAAEPDEEILNKEGQGPLDAEPAPVPEADPQRSLEEATSTVRSLVNDSLSILPKVGVALILLLLAWLLSLASQFVLRRALHRWEKGDAISALVRMALFLVAIGSGLSVISGDATALVGSVGLVGLALSWALQTPIESFTGWVLNAFRGYYRIGDRIEVGEVYGDVYRIGVLATTVWESGGPGKAVSGAQPTGALITFPNWEILRSNIINYSRDFPYVWEEITFGVANESDLVYSVEVIRRKAEVVVGEMMQEPAAQYQQLLERQRLSYEVERRPQVYLTMADMWTNCTVRYLVPLRERRFWSSKLILEMSQELSDPRHQGRIIGSYPRGRVEMLGLEKE